MRFLFLCLIINLLSCTSTEKRQSTFLGGHIVNPNSSVVILEHKDKPIDTIPLDDNNNFSYEFSPEDESIYTFRHYTESQTIYLNPGDSLVLRVNTLEFDESLSYGGTSSMENNFLINMFLMNEQDNDLVLSYYKIAPEQFVAKTDSILNVRHQDLEKLNSKAKFTPYFKTIAKQSIDYEHYDMRERYAFLIKKYVPNKFDEFPNQYFKYREQVDFNNPHLTSNFSYMRFLDNFLRNKSIESCEAENRDCFDLNAHSNLKRRLNLVHELFENEHLQANFFNRLIRKEIVFSQTQDQLEETLAIINKFDLQDPDKDELHQLTEVQRKYLLGNDLSYLNLRTELMDTVELHQVAQNKPTLLLTWSAKSFEGRRNMTKKVNALKHQFPELNFFSINLDFQTPNLWQNALKQLPNSLPEFQLISDMPEQGSSFIKNYLNRVYITDQNLVLTSNSLSVFDSKLENHIQKVLKN